MADNVIVCRSEDFAVRIVNIYNVLTKQRSEYVMSKQLLRCGTSIGANVAEAQEAQSDADFIAKLYIALKECSEVNFWLRILYRTDYLTEREFETIYKKSTQILWILITIIITEKINMQTP